MLSERLDSSQKTCQSLQSYIASLFSKLEEARSQTSGASSQHHRHSSSSSSSNQVSWDSHNCGDKCRRSASYAGLEIVNSHRSHDHSHRHSINTPRDNENAPRDNENPFRSRSHASSISSVSDSLKRTNTHDSGIERSSDVISGNDVISHDDT